jgi:vacuolar-type H+-ATPase subunit F/Vma7
MSAIVFIGDELSATGFRLTGIETVVADDDVLAGEVLAEVRKRAGLVIVTAAVAKRVPAAELERALRAESPIVAVIPDILRQTHPPDMAKKLRAVLGIES